MPLLRILYVEDNCELREAMGMLLEGPGRAVRQSADSGAAVSAAAMAAVPLRASIRRAS